MKPFSQLVDAVETLSDPEVEDYFLKILKSPELAAEDKYQKFIDFFRKESQIRTRMLHYARQGTSGRPGVDILSQVCQDLKLWNPQEMLGQTEESIKRAVRRLRDSQNQAPPEAWGGWGFGWKQSDCWATVHAVLCLNAARGLKELAFDADIDKLLREGIDWLGRNRWGWTTEGIPSGQRLFVYEFSLVAACFYRIEQEYFGEEFSSAVVRGIADLAQAQNEDGGWEVRDKTNEPQWRTGRQSEVGATSFALRALAETKNRDYDQVVAKGVRWLINAQNKDDGSWDHVDFRSGRRTPSVSKTGDALQCLLAVGEKFGAYQAQMDKAVEWLQSQEKPRLERGEIEWAWTSNGAFDLENTCLILETLVKMPDASLTLLTPLALLTSSAQWLIKQQFKEGEARVKDAKDVGKWDRELTARITLSLIEYYKKLRDFSAAGQPTP